MEWGEQCRRGRLGAYRLIFLSSFGRGLLDLGIHLGSEEDMAAVKWP
jgi:hypothetical protein